MALSPAFGYLSYSDRPGPGFHERVASFSWVEFWSGLQFGAGFGVLLMPFSVVLGSVSILIVRGIERLGAHRLIVVSASGLLFFAVSGYTALAMGWYIAAGLPLILSIAFAGTLVGVLGVAQKKKEPIHASETTRGK